MALSLAGPVGAGGANHPTDVRIVQAALKVAAGVTDTPAVHPGPVDGENGDGTEGAIEAFQRVVLHYARPDGRVDPGGYTARALAACLELDEAAATDGGGWGFPVEGEPTSPFYGPGAGMRAFRARRSGGGRAHAGDDLYRPVGTPVLAVAPGKVVEAGPFYLGTDAIAVRHETPGGHGYVVRYGEVQKRRVRLGETVGRGEQLAEVGRLRGLSFSMLHVEAYLGLVAGKLTQTGSDGAIDRIHGRPFRRRRDLFDITGLLKRAER